MFGILTSGFWAWLFWFTRPYRKARNLLVMSLCYITISGSAIGSIGLMLDVSERMGIGRHSQGDVVIYAYMVGLICVGVFVLKSEFKWRRSVGLDGEKI